MRKPTIYEVLREKLGRDPTRTVAGEERYQPEDLERLSDAPTDHDIVCTPFRAALDAWKAAREGSK